jgi:hypothetical protein
VEEDTNNDQTQLQKMRGLISRFKPSDKKVKLFFLSSSVTGIMVCTCLVFRAYFYQNYGLSFFHGSEFSEDKIFEGYEGELLIYIGYFLQVVAINTIFLIKDPSVLIVRLNKFIVIFGTVSLCLGLWFYCASATSDFVGIGYLMAITFGMGTLSNINFIGKQLKRNYSLENILVINCIIGLVFCIKNSLFSTG